MKCHRVKPFDSFHQSALSPDGFRPRCKVCRKSDGAKDYQEHKTKRSETQRAWLLENPGYGRTYRRRNRRRIQSVQREWRKENRSRSNMTMRINWARAKAKRLHRLPAWSDAQAIAAFYRRCPEGMTVDHIVPLQGDIVSGLHVLENLQYLSKADNDQKNNHWSVTN